MISGVITGLIMDLVKRPVTRSILHLDYHQIYR